MAVGQILDLRPMSTGSPLDFVLVETLQSQAMRRAVSRAMGEVDAEPAMVGRFSGVCRADLSTDTIT